ncbi:cytochrome c [Aliiroseovarius sediminis]|uniref:c-type cytochrome n=1 Tax=Aliiroseovarius sediminis TaxID=2925839 RepID=UPI001F575E20|nr:cytochrome c [Aliiroseovarius sediminis]MCI2395478.1 cytochrome c [Aliiroseovarius sediminis]
MTFLGRTVLALVISAPMAAPLLAEDKKPEPTNPVVIERMETMKAIGGGMKALADMAKGEAPFDSAKADASVAVIAEKAVLVPAKFEVNEPDPATEALPKIWDNYDDFIKKSEDMAAAATSVGPIGDQAALGAAVGKIGGTCKACHRDYRE